MRTRLLLILTTAIVLAACEKTIVLDLKQMPEKVVIEGVVTNHPGYQYVKVSRSVGFYDSGSTPRITDATVTITDDLGNEIDFIHNPNNHPDSMGYYLPAQSFTGQVGRHYILTVVIDGKIFKGEDTMLPVTTMDSIRYRINHREFNNPMRKNKYYELLLYAKEPRETRDYYLFTFFRNDTLSRYHSGDIYFSDDKVLGEEINGVQSPVFFAVGDTARVEVYSLTRKAYVYYSDLEKLLNNDGGMFSPPMATPRTNLSHGALGFFRVSAIDISGIRIE